MTATPSPEPTSVSEHLQRLIEHGEDEITRYAKERETIKADLRRVRGRISFLREQNKVWRQGLRSFD